MKLKSSVKTAVVSTVALTSTAAIIYAIPNLKINEVKSSDIDNIKEKDIIYYRYGNKYITHRVVDIDVEDGSYIFYTKGDNNNDVDPWRVKESDIVGLVKCRIKYLGWPSVWVYELLS